MALISVIRWENGKVGVVPGIVCLYATDNLATITTAGYLSANNLNGTVVTANDMIAAVYSGGQTWLTPSVSAAGIITLSASESNVSLPTIVNHIATYVDVGGSLSEDASTAINGGNIQAGLSGTAGYLASFPSAASKGSLRVVAVANTGDTLVTLSNALHGQTSVYSIPDSGAATANIIISKVTGGQHITVGSFQVDGGNISAGISGGAGYLASFPSAASKGSLRVVAVANTGDTLVTISNALHGQASVYSIPDSGQATANILTSDNASGQTINTGNLAITAGSLVTTNGGVIQSGSSGQAGSLKVFPATGSKGDFKLACADQTGNTEVTLQPSAMGQASVISIPDPGNANANVILSRSAGTQTIATGNIALTAGTISTQGASGDIRTQGAGAQIQAEQGDVSAGGGATAGRLFSYAGGPNLGAILLKGIANAGNFFITIQNASHAQSTVLTVPDIGAATGGVVVATSAIKMKSVAQAAVAGGAAAQTVTDAFCTSGSMVVCTWNDTTNAVTIQKAVAGNGSFVVTSSADPGASHLNYIITK